MRGNVTEVMTQIFKCKIWEIKRSGGNTLPSERRRIYFQHIFFFKSALTSSPLARTLSVLEIRQFFFFSLGCHFVFFFVKV